MKVGLYKQYLGGLHKGYLKKYENILKFNRIECIWLEASQSDFWDRVSELDLFIYQWEHYEKPKQIAKSIIPIIQYEMKIPSFPNWETSWHFDDKIKQYYLLKQNGLPVIESYIFWEQNQALNWLETARLPVIFKLKGGAGSSNVVLVEERSKGKRLIYRMFGKGIKSGRIGDKNSLQRKYFGLYKSIRRSAGTMLKRIRNDYEPLFWNLDKNYVLFQKYLPKNLFDTRISIIGDRAFAFRRHNREDDFRASGSGFIDYSQNQIDHRAIQIAFNISGKFGFQSMGYDFLFNEVGNLELAEISYTYVDKAVYNCPGYWDKNLNFHKGHFWPQYCVLADALKAVNLQQPELDCKTF